jgi:hypothetical protein
VGDVCVNGVCSGGLNIGPAETQNMTADANKVTYRWSPASGAIAYDALRGLTGPFPVGSSAAGEFCSPGLIEAQFVDETIPAAGTGFRYLSRARGPCGPGPWGVQSDGTARVTSACP